MKFVPFASVNEEDVIRLHMTGGGCSVASGACVDTEIVAELELSQEFLEVEPILEKLDFGEVGKLSYEGVLVADLNRGSTLNTVYGSVKKGRTLNYLTIEGREFIVYGEDGVSSAECEVNANYPEHGPSHEKCQTFGAESFDRIILCAEDLQL